MEDRWDEPTRRDLVARHPALLDDVALGVDERLVSAGAMLQALGLTPAGWAALSDDETPDSLPMAAAGQGRTQELPAVSMADLMGVR